VKDWINKRIKELNSNNVILFPKTNEYYVRLSRENHAKEIVAEILDNAIYTFGSKRDNKNNDT
tara:strand:- start:61 stop:249 length:189 start_codon:yes stop_codon:yes gene_type:complete